jgi:hypothetical protein
MLLWSYTTDNPEGDRRPSDFRTKQGFTGQDGEFVFQFLRLVCQPWVRKMRGLNRERGSQRLMSQRRAAK